MTSKSLPNNETLQVVELAGTEVVLLRGSVKRSRLSFGRPGMLPTDPEYVLSGTAGREIGLSSDLFKMLGGGDPASREISSTVLDGAPYLRDLSVKSGRDPHLEETWKVQTLYSSSKDSIELIFNLMQIQPLDQPLPRSIWKLIPRR